MNTFDIKFKKITLFKFIFSVLSLLLSSVFFNVAFASVDDARDNAQEIITILEGKIVNIEVYLNEIDLGVLVASQSLIDQLEDTLEEAEDLLTEAAVLFSTAQTESDYVASYNKALEAVDLADDLLERITVGDTIGEATDRSGSLTIIETAELRYESLLASLNNTGDISRSDYEDEFDDIVDLIADARIAYSDDDHSEVSSIITNANNLLNSLTDEINDQIDDFVASTIRSGQMGVTDFYIDDAENLLYSLEDDIDDNLEKLEGIEDSYVEDLNDLYKQAESLINRMKRAKSNDLHNSVGDTYNKFVDRVEDAYGELNVVINGYHQRKAQNTIRTELDTIRNNQGLTFSRNTGSPRAHEIVSKLSKSQLKRIFEILELLFILDLI